MMSEERGSHRTCTVQGKADGGRVEPTAKLEDNDGEKV